MVYPTAMQQMVAIARAIGFEAKLVIMDEPTSSLDEREVRVLFGVIRQLKAAGVSVIFVSHKLDELYAVCDRVTIMRDGRTVQVAPMTQLSRLDLVTVHAGARTRPRSCGNRTMQTASIGDGRQPVLTVQNLAAGRKVRDVSFEVGSGEIVGLAGLLGAGRTESVRAVFGADKPDSGTITFAGA